MTPLISVIVPCYNEERTIGLLLQALYQQTYPREQMEVILADGMSQDSTRVVAGEFAHSHPELPVRVVDNPQRNIPSALNHAIRAAQGEYIVRLDAHSVPAEDYVARCVEALQAGKGENVGGIWLIRPRGEGWGARSIAEAAAHPFGVGDALYRYAREAAYVDTVPFGAFRRDLLDKVGMFDETLLTNEDYEFNTRIRQQGGRVWLDPQIRSTYFARATLGELARQYWRYGFWKWKMLRRYPNTLRWRQALPPLFVTGLVGLAGLAIFWPAARVLLGLTAGLYVLVLVTGALKPAVQWRAPALLLGIPLAIACMHICWGSGFIYSMVRK